MPTLQKEQLLMRVFVGEADRWQKKPLYEEVVELFHREGLAGATVLRGVMGFGARSVLHADKYLRLSHDLPVVIEAVDSQEKIDRILPRLEEMLQSGMVTLERVQVIRYGTDR